MDPVTQEPVTQEDFARAMAALPERPATGQAFAVAVSGGPDSMALLYLLVRWAQGSDAHIHALIVDHGLRAESAREAEQVSQSISKLQAVKPVVLRWGGEKPHARILEAARDARYALMAEYMAAHNVRHLFVAHHQDDQAETVLIRLSKGSGLDGLAGMTGAQQLQNGIFLLRPLLDVPKQALISFCETEGVVFVKDPTNENPAYMRPRLRRARTVLEEEGLTPKRLSTTALRMARARAALDELTQKLYDDALRENSARRLVFDLEKIAVAPEELKLRLLLKAQHSFEEEEAGYGPRLERMEALALRLFNDPHFKSATLGGCIFGRDIKNKALWVEKEI